MEGTDFLEALSGVYYIATTDGDQPHVRPFDGLIKIDEKYFMTSNSGKKVFKQIKKNPKIEIFSMERGMVRFTAEAYPVEDKELTETVHDALGKDMTDDSVAIEVKNIKGSLTTIMGESFMLNL